MRWTLIGMSVAALAGSPLAVGAAIDKAKKNDRVSLDLGERNPQRGLVLEATRVIARTPGEAFKVSNSGPSGGGGLFTCASIAGGSAENRPPCLTATNRRSGSVFEFLFHGPLGGVFRVGADIDRQFPAVRPFVTNATGVATGLNADRVDGLHAQDIIDSAVARSSVQVGAQGPAGPQGSQGQRGPQGLQGPAGAPGTPLRRDAETGENAAYSDRRVVPLTETTAQPTASSADLLGGTPVEPLGPGTYIVQITFRAVDLDGTDPETAERYGVAGLFVNGELQSTPMWTPDVPDDVDGAMVSDTAVVTVDSGDSGILKVYGVVHSSTAAAVGGNVTVVVTEVNPVS